MYIYTRKIKILRLIIFIAIIALLLTSCAQKQEKPMIEKETEKIPESLKQMVEKTEELMDKLEGIIEESKKPEITEKEAEEGKKSTEDKNNESNEEAKNSKDKSQDPSKNKEAEKTMETSQKKQEKITSMWDDAKKISKEIHFSWSEYELLAMEKGLKEKEISSFEDSLNNLTVSIDEKSILNSLNYSNSLSFNMSPFFDTYKGNNEGYLMRIKYYIRQAYLNAMKDEWNKSIENIKEGLEAMNIVRTRIKLDKKDQDLMEKLNLSMINMNSSISKENLELLKVKRDITLKNIDSIMGKVH